MDALLDFLTWCTIAAPAICGGAAVAFADVIRRLEKVGSSKKLPLHMKTKLYWFVRAGLILLSGVSAAWYLKAYGLTEKDNARWMSFCLGVGFPIVVQRIAQGPENGKS